MWVVIYSDITKQKIKFYMTKDEKVPNKQKITIKMTMDEKITIDMTTDEINCDLVSLTKGHGPQTKPSKQC